MHTGGIGFFCIERNENAKVSKAMAKWWLRLPVYHPTQIAER